VKILNSLLRAAGALFIIYVALVLYINMRKENILSFALQEFEIKQVGDSVFIIGYRLGCARAIEYADSLSKKNILNELRLVEPIYDSREYLCKRYGIFYQDFF
jgi:hypothetical protein